MLAGLSDPARGELRRTFDEAADSYARVRPRYPAALYDGLAELGGLSPGTHVLEIGCGTGQATRDLARRWRVVAIELGARLAARARLELSDVPDLEIVTADFDRWDDRRSFDAVFAATAYHWLDPASRAQRCADRIRGGGALAIVSTWHDVEADAFWPETRPLYERWPPPPRPSPAMPDLAAELSGSGAFEPAVEREYPFRIRLDADEYLALLDTFSGHRAMDPEPRRQLYAAIGARICAQPGGSVERPYGCRLVVARRR